MTLTLLKANNKDIEQILEWDEEAKIASTGSGYSSERKVEKRKNFVMMLEDSRHELLIIKSKENPSFTVGCVILDCNPEKFDCLNEATTVIEEECSAKVPEDLNERRVHINSITVDQQFRGHGIGKLTLKLLESKYKTEGYKYISLHTSLNNRSMIGATNDSYTTINLKKGDGYEDNRVFMFKSLKFRSN